MKKGNIVFLAVMILFMAMISFPVKAAENGYNKQEAALYLREQMVERVNRISVEMNCEPTEEMAKEIFLEAIKHTGNPKEGDYLAYSTYWAWEYPKITIAEHTINFRVKYVAVASQEAEVDQAVEEIVKSLHCYGLSDYQKLGLINDWLIDNVEYQENSMNNIGSSYKALVQHASSCRGYVLSFIRLCTELGIEARFVYRDNQEHEWSIVKLGNKWYHVDCCGSDYENRGKRLCFLKGATWWINTGLPLNTAFKNYDIDANDYKPTAEDLAELNPSFKSATNTTSGINLSWTSVNDAAKYKIYRKVNSGDFAYLTSTAGTSYLDKNVQSGKTYQYKVEVLHKSGVCFAQMLSASLNRIDTPKGITLSLPGSKKLGVKYKKVAGASGYQIQYSLKSNFAKGKTVTTKALSTTIKKLQKKKVYYVRVRSFMTKGGKKYYSAWSKKYKKKTK